jgi:hypothetical protein
VACNTLGVFLLECLELVECNAIEVASLDVFRDVGSIVVFTNRADVEGIAVFRNLSLARVLVPAGRRPALGPQPLLIAATLGRTSIALRRTAVTLRTITLWAVAVTTGTIAVTLRAGIVAATEGRAGTVALRAVVVAAERRTLAIALRAIVITADRRTGAIALRTVIARRTLIVAAERRTLTVAWSAIGLARRGTSLGGAGIVVTTSAGVRSAGALPLGTLSVASWPPVAVSRIAHDVSCCVVCGGAS